MLKEMYDDIQRHKRDRELNCYVHKRATANGIVDIMSGEIRAGMLIQIRANERVPADIVVIYAEYIIKYINQ